MDRRSEHYLRSDFSAEMYGDGKSTVYERDLEVTGKSPTDVRTTAEWIRGKVMP